MVLDFTTTHIQNPITIDLTVDHVCKQLQLIPGDSKLYQPITVLLDTVHNTWSPGAVFRYFEVSHVGESEITLLSGEHEEPFPLATGWASAFLKGAEMVVGGAYTTGPELEEAARKASDSGLFLDSFILEQINLTLLSQTAKVVNRTIEKNASQRGLKLGPLLSPGSVHGWELSDQANLCAHLPLDQIDIRCDSNSVLSPFNSLTFLIGMGTEYGATQVGEPCEVCSNKATCAFNNNPHGNEAPKR